MSILTDKAMDGMDKMMDAAFAPRHDPDQFMEETMARDFLRQQVQAIQSQSQMVEEACRLTDEWANGFYLGRGTEPTAREYAAVGIGFYRELRSTGSAVAGDRVRKDGKEGKVVWTDDGFARVRWQDGTWTWEDGRCIQVIK